MTLYLLIITFCLIFFVIGWWACIMSDYNKLGPTFMEGIKEIIKGNKDSERDNGNDD